MNFFADFEIKLRTFYKIYFDKKLDYNLNWADIFIYFQLFGISLSERDIYTENKSEKIMYILNELHFPRNPVSESFFL